MRSGLLVVGLGEPPHQILEYVAAIHRADLVRTKVALGGGKFFDDQIQGAALHHPSDNAVKVELGKHILDIGGEPGQIVPEVGLNVVRVGEQQIESEPAGVIELVAGGAGEEAIDDSQLFDLFVLLPHGGMGGQQAVVESLYNRHGEDDQSVFVGLEIAEKGIGDVPDYGGFLLDIHAGLGNSIVAHGCYLAFLLQFCMI